MVGLVVLFILSAVSFFVTLIKFVWYARSVFYIFLEWLFQ